MGHFADDTEARAYQAKYCFRCVHESGCIVWALHMQPHDDKLLLQRLIPRGEAINNECSMFHEDWDGPPIDDYDDEPRPCGCRHDRRQHSIRNGQVFCIACGILCSADDLLAVMDGED